MMHTSGIVCLILPILYCPIFRHYFSINWNYVLIIIITLIITVFNNLYFVEYIYQLNLFTSLNERIETYSERIFDPSNNSIGLINIFNGAIRNILYPITAIFTMTYYKNKINISQHIQFIIVINSILGIAAVGVDMIFRICAYFFPFILLVLSQWCYQTIILFGKKYRLSFLSWVIILLPIFVPPIKSFKIKVDGTNLYMGMRYYPYNSIIFEEKNSNREKLFTYIGY